MKQKYKISKISELKSAFQWSLLLFAIFSFLHILGVFYVKLIALVTNNNPSNLLKIFSFGLFFILDQITIFLIYYLSLKKGIKKFSLNTYYLKLEYIAIISLFVMIYDALFYWIRSGSLELSGIGIISTAIMFAIPYFIKN